MQCTEDQIDPARLAALNVMLGVSDSSWHPFAHQAFFWDARTDLGTDGHPKTGDLIPDMGDARRMWAGGRQRFLGPLKTEVTARKESRLVAHQRKTGRLGEMHLITLRHEISQEGALCIVDEQDLIYLPPTPFRPAHPKPPPGTATIQQTRQFSTTDLFRYSALTFNGHRIHFDRDYAMLQEGYPGLVIHGPLLAQHLMLMAEAELGNLAQFSFRAVAPSFDFEALDLCARATQEGLEMWVSGPDNRLIMTALATGSPVTLE